MLEIVAKYEKICTLNNMNVICDQNKLITVAINISIVCNFIKMWTAYYNNNTGICLGEPISVGGKRPEQQWDLDLMTSTLVLRVLHGVKVKDAVLLVTVNVILASMVGNSKYLSCNVGKQHYFSSIIIVRMYN